MASTTTLTVISSDNESFEVTEAAASMSKTLRLLIMAGCFDGGGSLLLHDVTSETLTIVLEYCNKHAAAAAVSSSGAAAAGSSTKNKEDLASFDRTFIDGFDTDTLIDLVIASSDSDLEIQGLHDLACQKVAGMMRGKTVDEILEMFGAEDDSSPYMDEAIQEILEVQKLLNG